MPFRSKQSLAKDSFTTAAERAAFFPLFKSMLVKEFDIVDEKIEGNKAVVHAASQRNTGKEFEKTIGEIHLVWEDGRWKLENEKWETKTEVK
jgi:hypothetical protein